MIKTLGRVILIVPILISAFCLVSSLAEDISITSYYPSPYGSYRELNWGNYPNSKGKLNADSGASIALGGSGTPYLSFSNDMGVGQDFLLYLTGDNNFSVQGGVTSFADDAGLPDTIRVHQVIYCTGGW